MDESRSSKAMRVGVYIPPDLATELEEFMRRMGIDSVSKIVQHAIRTYLAEWRWIEGGEVAGAIGILYNHEVGNVDEALTDTQHRYLDLVIAAMHIHLDRENCLLIIAVRGDAKRIREFVEDIQKLKGVKMVKPMLMLPR